MMRLPCVYTILPGIPFAKALATQLWHEYKHDLPALSDVQIYVPNRRSVRALANMFLEVSDGQATLLPQLTPLGDIDEEDLLENDPFTLEEDPFLTPAIAPLERQILLTKMILAREDLQLAPTEAFRLAGDLASFLDRAHTENVDLTQLNTLVIGDLAGHWQVTCEFLSLIIEHWPNILTARGEIDPAARRNILLEKKIQALQKNPPQHRVIAAGSTGSIAASAELLNTIARLPNGCVILPGLDPALDDNLWDAIDATHPYYYQKQLIARMDIDRHSVQLWPGTSYPENDVLKLLHYAMQPQDVFDLTDAQIDTSRLNDVEFYAAEDNLHEAKIIALRLRDVLNHPDKTAMVVTPDRILAQHIQQEMQRWDIAINDSGGSKLSQSPLGVFLKMVAGLSASSMQSTHILGLMRHPLFRLHAPLEHRNQAISELEIALRQDFVPHNDLRQFRPDHSFPILADTLAALTPILQDKQTLPLDEWIKRHIEAAEILATSPSLSGVDLLWRNDEGEAASRLLLSLYEAAKPHDFAITAKDYSFFIDALLEQVTIRPSYGTHPRLTILSNIEARLQHADLVILAGLNETVWPMQIKPDTWLSRPMQRDIGFGSPDRRIGQSALDFMTLFAMPNLCITWAGTRDGTDVHPSRWIQQIFAVLKKNGKPPAINVAPYYHWAKALDYPLHLVPRAAPEFSPPVQDRPRKLPVTSIGLWQKDPYGLYAKYILSLRPLDALDRQPDARDWGNASHKILERFITENIFREADPRNGFDRITTEVLSSYPLNRSQKKAWEGKLRVIGDWLVADTAQHEHATVEVTKTKAMTLGDNSQFELYGRADHIDISDPNGIIITDYKTGSLPSTKSIENGLSPQLPLLGWLNDADDAQLRYIKLSGKQDKPVEVKLFKNSAALIDANKKHLENLLQRFYIDVTPYTAQALGKSDYDDYRHLKRVAEWAALSESSENEEEESA